MDYRETVVAAYNATEEAADGLALARLLASITDSDLLVARVLTDKVASAVVDRETQRAIRSTVGQTRTAMLAALPDESLTAPILPALGARVARELHDVARANNASWLVLGSSHAPRVGRVLFGGTAQNVINHAPCAVAVAPPGFRNEQHHVPEVIASAYDGTLPGVDALLAATDLARAAAARLRVICVCEDASAATRMFDDADAVVRDTSNGDVDLECVRLEGDPSAALVAASEKRPGGVGMLVTGSRALGPIRRALLGSVSARVVRDAECPVLVIPRRR